MSLQHVIFVNRFFHPDDSATAQMATDVAADLAAEGYRVSAVTSRRILAAGSELLPRNGRAGAVTIHRTWTPGFGRGVVARIGDYLAFYVAMQWRLLRLARRGDIVVAMTDPPMTGALVGWIARLRGAKVVNWLQDVYPEVAMHLGVLRPRSPLVRLLLRLRNRGLRRAAANVVLGERMGQHVRTVAPAAPVEVVPNWFEDFVRPAGGNPYRAELKLAQGSFVVGYAGNLGRAHRFDGLVEAAIELRGQAGLHFLIIGEGAQREVLQKQVQRAGLDNWTFLPYQPRRRAAEFLTAIDLHLISLEPALEGLIVPSKLYGILAAGRGSVFLGRPDSEVGALLEQDDCGAAVLPGDGAALARVILRVRSDPQLRGRWERNARMLYESRFSKSAALAQWRSLIARLAANR